MNMNRKKMFFIMLTVLLVFFAAPFTVFAAQEVSQVNINAAEPEAGETVDFHVTSYHPEAYHVDTESSVGIKGVKWVDVTTDTELKEGDIYQEGHEYQLLVQLAPESGYRFALDTQVGVQSAVQGNVNWKHAKVFLSYESMLKIYVTRTYMLPITLTEIEFHDVTEPMAGQTPQYNAIPSLAGYYVTNNRLTDNTGIAWYDLTQGRELKKEDTFVEGHRYRVSIYVVPKDGYVFSKFSTGKFSVTPYINGKKGTITDTIVNEIIISYDFEPCQQYMIDDIVLTNLLMPVPNAFAGYNIDIESYGVYLHEVTNLWERNGIFWHDVTGNYDITTTESFVGGHVYEVTVRLLLRDGCALQKDSNGIYKGTASINGKEAEVELTGGEIHVKCRFVCEKFEITNILLDEVDVPQIGAAPDYYIRCGNPEAYRCMYEGDEPAISWYEDGEWMYRTDKFKAGKTYSVTIYLEPVEAYGSYVAYFSDNLTATVNGKNVDSANIEHLGNYAAVTYTFSKEEVTTIRTVSIEGINYPVAGNYPDYEAVSSEPELYNISTQKDAVTKNGISWKNISTDRVMYTGSQYFEKDGVYEVYITVYPADGLRFGTKKDGTPDINAYINGKEADEVLGRSEYEAILVYSFDVNQFVDVPETTYYFEPILWAAQKGITAGTGMYTFGPEEECTRAQIVTFLWRAEGSPEPAIEKHRTSGFVDVSEDAYYYKAVLWAVENGITSGVTPERFCPDDKCTRAQAASFIWRYAGQEDVTQKELTFADVPSYAYYLKAVLWAVENKITSGYSSTTFAPDDTCTRGQIVTFLYRYF